MKLIAFLGDRVIDHTVAQGREYLHDVDLQAIVSATVSGTHRRTFCSCCKKWTDNP